MKNFQIEIKWGIIFTISTLLWAILEKSAGLHDENIQNYVMFSALFGILAISIYIIAIKDKQRNHYKGNITWTQGFLSGVIVTVIVAMLSPVAQYLIYTFISPDYFANAIEYNAKRGPEARKTAENLFNMKSSIIQGVSMALSMGVVTSAIVAYFVQTKPSKK